MRSDPWPVVVRRPETRGVRGQALVDEQQFAGPFVETELELRVRDENASRRRVRGASGVDRQAGGPQRFRPSRVAKHLDEPFPRDVLVVAAVRFGRKRHPQTVPAAWYSFQPEPARNPRTMHSTGSGRARRTRVERPASWASNGCNRVGNSTKSAVRR